MQTYLPKHAAADGRQPHATFFLDESGAKASSGNFFVVGGVKTLNPGRLQRGVEALRDEYSFRDEFKFSRINRGRLPVFRRLVELVAESDVRLVATVVDRSKLGNPFQGDEAWRVHARIAAQLVAGNLNAGQYAAVILDHVSTPVGVSFGDTMRAMANKRLGVPTVVSAVTVDSKANDLLQVADLIAGAVGNHRRTPEQQAVNHKARIANDLAEALNVASFAADMRHGRINILQKGTR